MSWTIYKKNGEERTVTLPLGASSRSGRLALPELEYNGEWMGETSVTLNVRCAVPVGFEIGDYIVYRGEKFVINYDPTVIKKARRGTYGEGFVYDNVKFVSLGYELTDMRMLDYVLNDNEIHYSSLPKFSFFCETVDDLADRLQVNADRYCSANGITGADRWVFVTPSQSRTLTRCGSDSALQTKARELYAEYFGQPAATDDEKTNQNVNIDDQSVWDAIKNVKDVFGLNFIQKGRSVVIGAAGLPTMDVFKYGKGNGLYEIERTADSDQQIVTMLMAYGSDKNLPTRYYANLNMTCWSVWHNWQAGDLNYTIIGVPYTSGAFNGQEVEVNGLKGRAVTFVQNGTTYKAFVGDATFLNSGPVTFEDSALLFTDGEALPLSIGDPITFTGGINKDKWPSEMRSTSTANLPNNMAVNVLMLPGFPNQSLYDWVVSNGGSAVADEHNGSLAGKAQWRGHTAYFSKEKAHPFILSKNYPDLGIREATKYFDGSDGDDEIFPTIENTGKDTIVGADVIEDNGIFADGAEIPTFKIILPDLGSDFDLATLLQSDTVIAMKNGYCGGREFGVESVKQLTNGTWECTCQRDKDNDLDLYFPYAHGTAGASLPYQLRTDDKYVLTGIEMTDTYVNAAAVKLLEEALTFLEKNDYTRYTYSPKVDEIFMARQHDGFSSGDTATYGTRSYHDTLKEGDMMVFADEDLNISGSVFIDVLRIKEYGNGQIPTYEVTLRNDKQVGTIQRLQEQVNSLATGGSITSGGGGGGSVNIPQIRQLIQTYGREWFLSKIGDDSASGLITFLKGLQIGAEGAWGYVKEFLQDGVSTVKAWFKNLYADYLEPTVMKVVDKIVGPLSVEGNLFIRKDDEGKGGNVTIDGSVNAQDGNFSGMLTTQNLTVTGLAHFFELMIDKLRSSGGAFVFTPADGFSVEDVTSTTIGGVACKRLWWRATDGETETDNQWLVGDQAICMSFNLARKKVGEVMRDVSNKMFWSVVCEKGTTEHDFGEDTALGHYITIYTGVNSSTPIATDDSGKPLWSGAPYEVEVGDDIAMLGHRMQADEDSTSEDLKARQSAVYISAYASYDTGDVSHGIRALQPPLLAFYKGVDDFNLALHRGTFMDAKGSEFKGKFLSTSSSQEGIDIETLLSGSEVDIIYGNGNPNTVSTPHAAWSDAEKLLRVDKTLYFDLDLEPASEGGRLWKWTRNTEGEGYVWVQVNDVDSTAALDKISDVASDGKLTGGAEKTRVYLEWMDAVKTHRSLWEQKNENKANVDWLDDSSTAPTYKEGASYYSALFNFDKAFWALGYYLNGKSEYASDAVIPLWLNGNNLKVTTELPPFTESPQGKSEWTTGPLAYKGVWNDWYDAVVEMTRALNAAQYKAIDEMGDDGLIDPAEKAILRQTFWDEVRRYRNLWIEGKTIASKISGSSAASAITSAISNYEKAVKSLGTYLDGATPNDNGDGTYDFKDGGADVFTWWVNPSTGVWHGTSNNMTWASLLSGSTISEEMYPLWITLANATKSTIVKDAEWDYFWKVISVTRMALQDAIATGREYQLEHIDVELAQTFWTRFSDTGAASSSSNTTPELMPGESGTQFKKGDQWNEEVSLLNPATGNRHTTDSDGKKLYNVYICTEEYAYGDVSYANLSGYWQLVSKPTLATLDNDGSSIKAAVFNSSEFSLIEQKVDSVSSTVSKTKGTKNLIVNSDYADGTSRFASISAPGYGATFSIPSDATPPTDIPRVMQVQVTGASGGGVQLTSSSDMQPNLTLKNGQKYTLSFYAKVITASATPTVRVLRLTTTLLAAVELTSEWKRYSMTFTGDGLSRFFRIVFAANTTVQLAGLQLEEGSQATLWQPYDTSFLNLQSQINQQADAISLAVKVNEDTKCGLFLEYDEQTGEGTTTLKGDQVIIDGDLDVKGLIENSSQVITHNDAYTEDEDTKEWTGGFVHDGNDFSDWMVVPIDLVNVKSVVVKGMSGGLYEANDPTTNGVNTLPIVVLPGYDKIIVNGMNSKYPWTALRRSGIQISIVNEFHYYYREWAKSLGSSTQTAAGKAELGKRWNGAILVVSDPRLLRYDNYYRNGEISTLISPSGYYDDNHVPNSFVLKGLLGKIIAVMPGQTLSLVSHVESRGDNSTNKALLWHVQNASEFDAIAGKMKVCVDDSDTNVFTCNFSTGANVYANMNLFAPSSISFNNSSMLCINLRVENGKWPYRLVISQNEGEYNT